MNTEHLKIGIIGVGKVGKTTAFCIAQASLVDEIILIDVNNKLAKGEAEDINHCLSLFPKETIIKASDYKDLKNSKIIIITAGIRRKENETRLSLINKNISIVKDIAEKLRDFKDSILLVVSNPVDIMTYITLKVSSFPKEHVFGLGTYIDTLRLFSILKREKRTFKKALVIGEHGESMVFVSYKNKKIMDRVRNLGSFLIEHKQGAEWAVGMACLEVVKAIIFDKKMVFPLSSLVSNWHGVSDICISVPTLIGRDGIIGYPPLNLTTQEEEAFLNSARIIRDKIIELSL